MERIYGICFVCQDYKINVGHVTSLCPKVTCIKCGQNGHFRIDCKNDETEVGQESKAVDFSITDGEASVFKPDNFIKVKNMKSLLKMESANQAVNDGFSQSEENALMISGIIPQNNEQKQFTFEEESNTKPCETEPLDKLKRQLAEVFERKSNKTIEDLKAQLTASQWVVSEMKTNKNEEIRMIKSDERERYDYLLKVKSDLAQFEKSQLISDEREKYDSLLKSECDRHNKITQDLEKSQNQLETKLRVSVENLRNESLIKESHSKIQYLEKCVLLEANQSKELCNKLVKSKALKEKYEKECSLIGDFKESLIKETNSLNTKIEKLERCILLETNQSKELYNKLVKAEELKESYKKECSIKDSRIEDLNEGWIKKTNSLNVKNENLERYVLLEANQSKELHNKLVEAEGLGNECLIKDSRIKELKEGWIKETNSLNVKIENLERCILLEANQSKELCNKLVRTEALKEKYEKECSLKESRIGDFKESWIKDTNSLNTKIENLERCMLLKESRIGELKESWIKDTNSLNTKIENLERSILLEENRSKNWYNKLVKAEELKESYKKECSIKDSRIEDLKKTNSLNVKIENLERYVLLEANQSKELHNNLVEAEGLKEKYEKECSIKDSRIKELEKMYKEESSIKDSRIEELEKMYKDVCSIKDSRIEELEKMYQEECSIKDSTVEELEKLYEKECADHEITESLKDGYIDDIQGLYIEINEYQLQLASFKLFNDRQAQGFVIPSLLSLAIPNKLMKNPNEGHTGNGTMEALKILGEIQYPGTLTAKAVAAATAAMPAN